VAFEITVGPPNAVINEGYCALITEHDGQIHAPSNKGLYFLDTRLLSSWQIRANSKRWDLLNFANIAHYAVRICLINRAIPTEQGTIPAGTVGLEIGRCLSGGIHEDLQIVNYGMKPIRFNLEIALRSDFADLFEVKANKVVRRGRIVSTWCERELRLTTSYQNKDFRRALAVSVRESGSRPVYANGRVSFDIALEPKTAWHACLLYDLQAGNDAHEAPGSCFQDCFKTPPGKQLQGWREAVLKVETRSEPFQDLYLQALDDLAALRLPIASTTHDRFVPAAGVPWFLALFGRDTLITSIESLLVRPEFALAALDVLGSLQARERDDYRDAEPGKIMHELRRGELAHFHLIPHTPYYGTADATMLYLIVLHMAWRVTGDLVLLHAHLATAERCLEWIDRYGDRDGDGFQEYQTRSSAGYENQGWKDAGDAVVNPDGTPVHGPKALCELQGYVFDAWVRCAEIFDAVGQPDRASSLRGKAAALFRRFNEAFWDEPSGFYAYALDGDKRKVLTVASNPGHCLWSGIVPKDRAARVVERLMRPDMWTGWGIRTLSANNPAYNPHSYQNGSVWPHDNAIIASGFRRYGHIKEAQQTMRDVSLAGSFFMRDRMPELYAGIKREPTAFPVQYLGANVPQAWAAASIFALLQVVLGAQPDAPGGRLYIDPALPEWLPELRLTNLRLGEKVLDLRFWREPERTCWEVMRGAADVVASRSFGFVLSDGVHMAA
jgi:glycogen debranching enzyme